MKTRKGFVSNSSSSSFVISKNVLNGIQIGSIINHGCSLYFKRSGCRPYDIWNISEDEFCIYGSTGMDNFDMEKFLRMLGVNMNTVEWGD